MRYPVILFFLFLVAAGLLAIDASPRLGWAVEQVLVVLCLPVLVWSYYRFRLSNLSYTLIFLFLLLHEIGSHWSYWVPLDWTGFDTQRNHYDRIVHFGFGLFLALPAREVIDRLASPRWPSYFAFEWILAASAVYEILEWLASLVLAPDAGDRFVGLQGDIFDPIKDMALGALGAVIALVAWRLWPGRREKEEAA